MVDVTDNAPVGSADTQLADAGRDVSRQECRHRA